MPNALLARAEATGMQLLYGLPHPVRRLIAGPPIRIDGQELALDAQLLLRLQQLAGSTMAQETPELARQMLTESQNVISGKPIQPVTTTELVIPDDNGGLPATLYTPAGVPERGGLLVFFHGGGWVIGTRASHDNAARFFARYAQVRVLSVEYRLAPEHPFPAAADDAVTAFDYARTKAPDLGADPERIAVGGDSAGGNLAAVIARVTTDRGGPAPAFQLLLYPALDATTRRRSRDVFGQNFFITETDINWFVHHYVPDGVDPADTRLSPLAAKDFSRLPPAFVMTAGFDPLRDDGEAYAGKLRAAGVQVALSRQSDLIHGFMNFLGIGHRFREAAAEAAGALRLGLALGTG